MGISVKKILWKKNVDLLLIEEKAKRNYVLIKDFNTFMNNRTLHHRKMFFGVIVYKLSV